jgi:polyhydroxybutyrate depolymerase
VCGAMADGGPCGPPKRPVSALIIAGTDDPLVPFEGGQVHFGRAMRGAVIGIEATVDAWRRVDGLGTAARVSEIPQQDTDGYTHATRFVYAGLRGPKVEFVRIDGGGHVEPSAKHRVRALYARIVRRSGTSTSGWPGRIALRAV